MNWSSRNTTLMSAPASAAVMTWRSQRKAGERRSTSPTWFVTPAVATVPAISRAPARLVASGFSQKIARPRSAAALTSRGCSDVQVQM